MVFNDLDIEWGQLLHPTQGIMQAYIALPWEKETQTRFRGKEKYIKPLRTIFSEHFLQQVTGQRNKNRMFSNSRLLQQRMHLTIQHLRVLGITLQEGESLAAAYHWSVQQVSYLDNINTAREDHNKVTQLLEECQAALAIKEITHRDQIIKDMYVEHLQGYTDRQDAAVARIPQL